MKIFRASIDPDGAITYWQGRESAGDINTVAFVIPDYSASQTWEAFKKSNLGWLHPVSEAEGAWAVEYAGFEAFLINVYGEDFPMPLPPLKVSVSYEHGVCFAVSSAN